MSEASVEMSLMLGALYVLYNSVIRHTFANDLPSMQDRYYQAAAVGTLVDPNNLRRLRSETYRSLAHLRATCQSRPRTRIRHVVPQGEAMAFPPQSRQHVRDVGRLHSRVTESTKSSGTSPSGLSS